ncbi:lysine-ketoglutarate reductase/saccharopine dehydrogenase-like protein (TIGR00300 family) [Desulfobaculum xiamenense]|uniref:Lysine-ketoglutarate reductase/saccharopine dehydrogenase-like protein (TIGR00300 family) n=1 Tax=Desulfobaculum xiamenense TaxID=995050 RepID=A0A846QG01_9BACT|nr:hypothetical protein [Desulfobaculum xiamenense]NJB67161.1 lysine-ketoglutarate reductase/saccharopine dehydrogenase-like protein (TIGR00300 family) [Desulfobaculum xiamenense]
MPFALPAYNEPDFAALSGAPLARFEAVITPGVAPDGYHATTIFPEYFQLAPQRWIMPAQSRMDCVVVRRGDELDVVEFRRLAPGDMVCVGRRENGEDGIYVHTDPFGSIENAREKFAFRTRMTRESSFSIDYDELYDLLEFERENGFIVWVLGPAVIFDHDSREALTRLVEAGYVHGLLAGNALATHDLEAAMHSTALGQEIYTRRTAALGHYHHLDALNEVRRLGSMRAAMEHGLVKNGVMRAIHERNIPFVLAGSIRDDGPMPEVVADCYKAQDAMRNVVRQATTVMAMATQLHSIATGNMTPSYTVTGGSIRPVYFYSVDMSEFVVDKLANRGSLSARSILTNVQDFLVTTERGLRKRQH